MPYRKRRVYRKKRVYKRKVYRKKKIIPRGLRQGVIPLQREITTFLNTANALPSGWAYGQVSGYNTLQHNQIFHMNDLPEITEMSPVFRAYRLNCILVSICNLHPSSMFTTGSPQNYYGGNVQVYTSLDRTGTPLDTSITQAYWDQLSAKRSFVMRGQKTHYFKIYPKILSNTYISSITQTTTQRRPGWIATSTAGLSVPHFGMNFQFSLLDPSLAFNNYVVPQAAAPLNFKITYRYLFQMRGVH